tara:strand:- start:428 stop:691 length:264 start_codon:yes stop_codon:yes gene_type:complete
MTDYDDKVDEEVEKRLDALTEDQFNEWLDELDEPYTMGNLTFYPSDILKSCDPIAYDMCFTDDYQESMRESIEEQVRDEIDDDEDDC